ncbi:MAG: DNA polymerase III subunit alpha [Planctomycetia bacterium]|nr:DNA polymerase III subunit alpha [Planctomycetia bacterium]
MDKAGSSCHLTLLAMNEVGYKNLLKLTSKAHVEGLYYKPRIDFSCLEQHSEGIFALSGCMSGEVSEAILERSVDDARAIAGKYKELFGDRYAIEVHNHGHEKQRTLNPALFGIADWLGAKAVAACDSHYARPEDAKSHDAMLAIQTGSTLNDPKRFKITPYGAYYLRGEEEMLRDFFEIPQGHTPDSWLTKQVYDGLAWRYGTVSTGHKERADYELSVIKETGYALYFLIVQDYVRFARLQGVMAVPRGSVAGSLCVYSLGICDIDPVKYDIMFERFLHKDRKGMPDIDMDFADNRRADVIEYVTEKYGKTKVAHVGTFLTLGSRAAVKDIARVMEVPFDVSNSFTSLFVDTPGITLDEVSLDPKIIRAMKNNPQLNEVFSLAKEIEGLTRGFGTHAAGILITATDLDEVVPVQLPPEKSGRKTGTFVTQYDNNNSTGIIESLGLSKFDFLGLANLTIIKDVCELIKQRHDIDLYGTSGEKLYSDIPIEYSNPLAQRTYDLLARGDTAAVFQLESVGMRRALRLVRPSRITDLPAIVALYRPGPMEHIPDFATAKNNSRYISYLHDDLREILEETYGVVVYQDQVLLIARKIAGFSWGEVDVLRKGMGKKQISVIEEQKEKFISGSMSRGYDMDVASDIWETIAPFAGYGFNRAHAFCYGYISYITAYLKANYSIEYMTTVMTYESNNKEKISESIAECRRMGIQVIPPMVNVSSDVFSIAEIDGTEAIAFGLSAVSGMSSTACKTLVFARVSQGKFESFHDFLSKINLSVINQKGVANLIKAGSLDEFGERASLIESLPKFIESARERSALRSSGQLDMFGDGDVQSLGLLGADPMTRSQRLEYEYEVLGVYLSEHPLDDVRHIIDYYATHNSQNLMEGADQSAIVGGVIRSVRDFQTKNGKMMSFLLMEDQHGQIDIVLFSNKYISVCGSNPQQLLDRRVLVKGEIRVRDGKPSVICDDIVIINPDAPVTDTSDPVVLWSLRETKVSSRLGMLWTVYQKGQSSDESCVVRVHSDRGTIDMEVPISISSAMKVFT